MYLGRLVVYLNKTVTHVQVLMTCVRYFNCNHSGCKHEYRSSG